MPMRALFGLFWVGFGLVVRLGYLLCYHIFLELNSNKIGSQKNPYLKARVVSSNIFKLL